MESKEAVARLRANLRSELTPAFDADFNLLRFLQGHDFDLDKVTQLLRKHLQFRRMWDLDEVRVEGLPSSGDFSAGVRMCHSAWPVSIVGDTRADGRDSLVLAVEQLGIVDSKGLHRSVQSLDFLPARLAVQEQLLAALREREVATGRQHRVLCVVDMAGLQVDLSMVKGDFFCTNELVQSNYVELIHKILILNANPVFQVLWSCIKHILPKHTASKIDFVGREELLELVDSECLPEHYGGTLKTPGFPRTREECLIPASLYYEAKKDALNDKPWSSFSVPAGKTATVTFDVAEAKIGRRLLMRYKCTEKHSLALRFRASSETSVEDLVPPIDALIGPVTPNSAEVFLERAGAVEMAVGNESAWLFPVEVAYQFILLD